MVIFALGLLLIGYQIAVLGDNGFFYLIGTGICLYCLNRFLLQISCVRIAPTLLVPFLFSRLWKTHKDLLNLSFQKEKEGQICQKTKVLRKNASKSGT